MKKVLLYLHLGLILFFASCRPDPIDIKLPEKESQVVVASQIIPNKVMIVALSRTFNALVPTDTGIGNNLLNTILVARGRVTVTYEGKTDTLVQIAPGFYGTFTTPLKDNVHYYLEVFDSTTGKTISAETQLKPRISIDSAWVVTDIKGKDTTRTLHIEFTDPNSENFYMVNVYRNADFFVNAISNPSSIFRVGQTDLTTTPLTDKLFSQPKHTEKVNLDGWFQSGDTLRVTLSHVAQDYYSYLVQKKRAARNGLSAFFGEPVNYTTNVRNGLGFFTAHWPDSRVLIIK